jgi:hypothetical protein
MYPAPRHNHPAAHPSHGWLPRLLIAPSYKLIAWWHQTELSGELLNMIEKFMVKARGQVSL